MTCYCCRRMSRNVCLGRGDTCRRCLRCANHCEGSQKPKGPACAKPKPPVNEK
ncbi:hypothetical protein [Frigoriglobus tundricola]|uniref:Uncharacterized protein n=1 Tax=Frigoriglobus tundricola TaxID=2774151 RepID=A0A6M5YJY9_9BACT|nr:hypothetical protein [Frigoriglobus tundricola]QJW94357.1 hypothetical protein FTUN_1877 [Frigoriglobus tundricola]